MKIQHALTMVAALSVINAACAEEIGGPSGDSPTMSATLNGTAFQVPSIAAQGSIQQGVVNIAGSHTVGGVTTMVTINLINTDGPGVYQLDPNFAGAFAQVSKIQGIDAAGHLSWSTVMPGGTGTVNFTKLDPEGARGTFQFTAHPASGNGATGEMVATNGKFFVKF